VLRATEAALPRSLGRRDVVLVSSTGDQDVDGNLRCAEPARFRCVPSIAHRLALLAAGEPLSAITRSFCERLGIGSRIVPMTDARVATRVVTVDGELAFQDYFVRRRAEPRVTGCRYAGAGQAMPPAAALDALRDPRLRAIFIAPSNPWLSIDPILAVPALRRALRQSVEDMDSGRRAGCNAWKEGRTHGLLSCRARPSLGCARFFGWVWKGVRLSHSLKACQ